MTDQREIRNKANRYFFTKVVFNVCLIIFGALLISFFLRQMQHSAALQKQQRSNETALNETIEILTQNQDDAGELTDIFHDSNQDMLDDLQELLESGLYDSLADADDNARASVFADMVERSRVDYLFVMDEEGTVLISPNTELTGTNLRTSGLLSDRGVDHLIPGTRNKEGTVSPARETTEYGDYYFYSVRTSFKKKEFVIVLGAKAEVLDVQLASLRDLSAVLSSAAVNNNGFMFAVDSRDYSFLYYPETREELEGTNAIDAGLTEEALEDGYAGRQTIGGVNYYCVSRKFGNSTVICAVAETEDIYYNDKYVLFWSITGFILVMLLCLAYAIIVRNDFVRHAVQTERKVIGKRKGSPVYFDISIFKKVFPLMIAGVLLIYGISFYTQTLLEISESIENSDLALNEVTARYEESNRNRELIRNYYDNRFLSKARLLSYLIEEDPSVLNEKSERYYTDYDKTGDRYFILDDEGNPLKSISESEYLKQLCEENDLDSVYIFDENGHTIATSTSNWYFAVSHNEKDQSYVFLDILDGRKDACIQEAMVDDFGAENQYIGVKMMYYTAKDQDGNTIYVSHKDYEAQSDENIESEIEGEITRHRSMLQIGLNSEISSRILASTDIRKVLSSDMLTNGSILLFDSSDEHKCLYSPVEASIGKPAASLGVSDNAFTGLDYYGFRSVNNVTYFMCFRYVEGYFIATAVPKSEMYQSRFIISLITAFTSLLLILFLSGTVTLTTEEEEMLYATMSESQQEKGLDSAIFNIILPSGKQASTTKAAARWNNKWIPWNEKSPEQKLLLLISIVFGIMIIYVLISVIGVNRFFEKGSVIQYILSRNWDREANVFALSACMIVLIMVTIIAILFRLPVQMASSLLGARGETIAHLLLSVVKYGGTIFAVFYCLYLVGMDAQNLLASAGILSLVIGLGAQSLIKDIIAGIFIVFEGEFRVGDIVTIGGFRGTVMDIGLRTTKILGVDGNIKIYNNSDITGVLNMTKEASYAFCRVSIEYGQDIDYVEEVLRRELPGLKEKDARILDGPVYAGVAELGQSGVTLAIWAKCNELNIIGVTRYLNREILQIFNRNHINVPFPQVTVSYLPDKQETPEDPAPVPEETEKDSENTEKQEKNSD